MSEDLPIEPQRSNLRRLAGMITYPGAIVVSIFVVLGLTGQTIRDRSLPMALTMYIPLLPIGLVAVALDLSYRGRALPRLTRFTMTFLGSVAIVWSVFTMMGEGLVDERREVDRGLTLLHWNTQWGGGLLRGPTAWKSLRTSIVDRRPDLVILSEAPSDEWLRGLAHDLGNSASFLGILHDPRSPYWYHMAVCSQWPIHLQERLRLPGGVAMSVTAQVRGIHYRVLVVDGLSSPLRSRLPFLHEITRVCLEASSAGQPYDFVVGDFNTLSRSIGFDGLSDQGYQLASRKAMGWRATFPAWLPLYDIDHIWTAPGLRTLSCSLFNSPWTDHRGQFVRVSVMPKTPDALAQSHSIAVRSGGTQQHRASDDIKTSFE